jgi:hypothetical protein
MKKILGISFCAVCLSLAGFAAQTHSEGSDSKASFQKWVEQANKAQTDNDAKWMEANLAGGYVEGTSFGTWIPKLSTRKTPGESDLGGAVQCGSRIETAREPTTRSLLLSVPAMVR